jgi:hypothetical protein
MKLQPLDDRTQAELIGIAQAQQLLDTLETNNYRLFPEKTRENALRVLQSEDPLGHYDYRTIYTVVEATHWIRDGYEKKQLVIIFCAKPSNPNTLCSDHSVFYWVEADGSLSFIKDSILEE